ncbi:translocation/assembly module TamB domain-containing protein [Microbulbifer sp. 2201CG32-9]|uniref:translocation/assembly module TamB domain-containing protein n=1 Tax=Microbulbifer sp. 2201CG32-9 TaxID=3232309 RepID=UPI00345B7C71
MTWTTTFRCMSAWGRHSEMRRFFTAVSAGWSRYWSRRTLRWLGLCAIFLLGAFLLLGTEFGRVSLVRGALTLSRVWLPDLRIRIESIGSTHLGQWSFGAVTLKRGDKTLLQARQLALDVDPVGLFTRKLDVKSIRAGELLVDGDGVRKPTTTGDGEQAAAADPTPVAAKPRLLPAVRLGRLEIGRLHLSDSRFADLPDFSLSLNGRYHWPGEGAALDLQVRALDGSGLHLLLSGTAQGERDFAVSLGLKEKPGGFAGRRLHLSPEQGLDMRGRLLFQREKGNRFSVEVGELSMPLAGHQVALTGDAIVQYSPWNISTDGLQLRVDDSRHQLSGSIGQDSLAVDIQLNKLPVAVSQPWQSLLTGGWLTADLTLDGTPAAPHITGVVDLQSQYAERPFKLQGQVETLGKRIDFSSAMLEFASSRVDAGGSVDIAGRTLDLNGEVRQMSLDDLRQLLVALPATEALRLPTELQGQVEELLVRIEGPWNNPRLDLSLAANPSYRQVSATLDAHLEGDFRELELAEFVLQADGLTVTGGGSVSLMQKTLQLQMDMGMTDFRPAPRLQLSAAEGMVLNLDAAVEVFGPWQNPRIDTRLSSHGSYRDYHFLLTGNTAGNLQRIELQDIRLDLDTNPIEFPVLNHQGNYSSSPLAKQSSTQNSPVPAGPESGAILAGAGRQPGQGGAAWLEMDGEIEPGAGLARGTLAARNLPVSLAELTGMELPPSLDGQISVDATFSGPLANPEVSANLMAAGDFRGEYWRAQGDIEYGQGLLELDQVELVWAERNQLSAQGSLNRRLLDLEIRAVAQLEDLDLPYVVGEGGQVTFLVSAKGSPQRPRLDGELILAGARRPLQVSVNWHTEGEYLHASANAEHGGRQALDASAELMLTPLVQRLFSPKSQGAAAPPLQMKTAGSADLSVLAEFIDPEIHAMRGQFSFDISAQGTFRAPELDGRLQLTGGGYEHRPSNTRLRNIELLAEMTPAEWRIEQARADAGTRGQLDLVGVVRFPAAGAPILDFQLRTERAELLDTPAVSGSVSGILLLTGTTTDAELAGRLTLRPLTVQVEQLFGGSVPEIDVVEVEADGPQLKPASHLLQRVALDVEVVLDQQSYVRGLGLDSALQGRVDVSGTLAEPSASGSLQIVRGTFDLLGKRFDLQEGEVQFDNNQAAIFVKGRYEYSEGEIIAQISGTTDDLDITFSSTPAAAQDEIFAQLLFGKSLTDISPLQALRLVSAINTLKSGRVAFDPVERTRRLLGVDTLDIQTEDTDDGDQYALSLGKYITNRIYVELQRSTDPLTPWKAKMQIELRPNLNLQFKSADDNESGAGSVELQWKKDY